MSNSIATVYQAHRMAVETTGAGAEWPDLANRLAAILVDRLSELPLDPPLRYGWAYPVMRPNGEWPNLVVIHERSRRQGWNSCQQRWTHSARLVFIFGPANIDRATVHPQGTPYLWAINEVLQENQTLDGLCNEIVVGDMPWGELPYAGGSWYGLSVALDLIVDDRWTRRG